MFSHSNIYNGFNTNISQNLWKVFFNQLFGYILEKVKKMLKILNIECDGRINRLYFEVYYDLKWNILSKYNQ